MVNQSVNEFYTRFILKIDALPQDVVFLLDITTSLFNNLSPNVRNFLTSEGVHNTQDHQLKPITRETRGSFWSEMRPQKHKIK